MDTVKVDGYQVKNVRKLTTFPVNKPKMDLNHVLLDREILDGSKIQMIWAMMTEKSMMMNGTPCGDFKMVIILSCVCHEK